MSIGFVPEVPQHHLRRRQRGRTQRPRYGNPISEQAQENSGDEAFPGRKSVSDIWCGLFSEYNWITEVPDNEKWRLGLLDSLLCERSSLESEGQDVMRVVSMIGSLCNTWFPWTVVVNFPKSVSHCCFTVCCWIPFSLITLGRYYLQLPSSRF